MQRRLVPTHVTQTQPPTLSELSSKLRDTFRNLRNSIPDNRNRTGAIDVSDHSDAEAAIDDIKAYTRLLEGLMKSIQDNFRKSADAIDAARTRAEEQFHIKKIDNETTNSQDKEILKRFYNSNGRRTCYICSNAGSDGICKTFNPHFGPQKEQSKVTIHIDRHFEKETAGVGTLG